MSETIASNLSLDIKEIMKLFPARFPMLLIDKVNNLIPGEKASGIKAVTYNEPFFQGHYPSCPRMPGIFIIEAMQQLTFLMLASKYKDKDFLYAKVDKLNFYKLVYPPSILELESENKSQMENCFVCGVKACVEGDVVAKGYITDIMVDGGGVCVVLFL